MPLLPWRKLQAGIRGQTKSIQDVVQHITNTTVTSILNQPSLIGAASTTIEGVVELATIAETSTGTDTERAVTPDGLAGSILGTQVIGVIAVDSATSLTVADGKAYMPVPSSLNGMNLIRAQAIVNTAGTTNATTIDIYNVTDSQDMLSTAVSIASGATVGTVGTINTTYDDVATNDVLRVDVTTMSTTAPKGLLVVLEFRLP